jgi:tetratricopeptide (TPR) repeat protein
LSVMCETKDKVEILILEAHRLSREGRAKEAVALFLQAFDLLRKSTSCQTAENVNIVNPRNARLNRAADVLTTAAILETRIVSDNAIARFESAAELALSARNYGAAIISLETAEIECRYGGKPEKATELHNKIETILQNMPSNLEDCFTELELLLTPEFMEEFRSKRQREIIPLYRKGLFWRLDNNWALWLDSPLKKLLGEKGARTRRNMVDMILIEFHRHLNKPDKEKQVSGGSPS